MLDYETVRGGGGRNNGALECFLRRRRARMAELSENRTRRGGVLPNSGQGLSLSIMSFLSAAQVDHSAAVSLPKRHGCSQCSFVVPWFARAVVVVAVTTATAASANGALVGRWAWSVARRPVLPTAEVLVSVIFTTGC